jgi:RNA polymerase sigma-70 factor, ECF subfamily
VDNVAATLCDDGRVVANAGIFEQLRPRLFGIAYRLLGSVQDSEDVLQDAWLRWETADRDAVAEPGAYLATVVTRLSIASLTSARVARESYVGPWLPEPVDTSADPLLGAERSEALSLAVLVLLERLSPAERAAFVLHAAFDYPHSRVAEVLETSEANARQLFSRARKHLDDARPRAVSPAERGRLLAAFVAAAQAGDLEALEGVLAAEVVSISDGGGVVPAARKIVAGPERVAHFLLGVLEKYGQGMSTEAVEINGEPAMLARRPDGSPIAIWTIDAGSDGIEGIFLMLNPQKLSRFAAPTALS